MGLGDFAKGVGDAVKTGLTKVGDTAIDIGKDLGGSLKTLADINVYAHNPTHWDDIGRGAAKAVEFTAENPGTAAKIGGTVAKGIVKDSVTTPSGIFTTALGVASGGAGLAGKVAAAGKIIKGASTAGKIARGAEGVSAASKVVRGAEVAGEAGKVAEGISAGAKVTKEVSTLDKVLGAGVEVGKSGALQPTKLSKIRDPLRLTKGRTAVAERVLAGAGEEAPSIGRQVMAGLIQGVGGTKPTQLAGVSDDVYKAQEAIWRVRKAGGKLQAAPTAGNVLNAAANPRQAAFNAATSPQGREVAEGVVRNKIQKAVKQFEEPGTGQQVLDFGQPKPAGYGGPGEQLQLPLEWPKPAAQTGTFQPLEQPKVATSMQPLSTSTTAQATSGSTARGTAKAPIRGRKSLRAWQGPGREVFGGITPGFDWRDRNWGIERPHRTLSFADGTRVGQTSEEETMVSQGQQPKGSPQPNVKTADEPMDLSQPGTMNISQFPTTKVVPGSSLQSGGSVKFSTAAEPAKAVNMIGKRFDPILRQPKLGV